GAHRRHHLPAILTRRQAARLIEQRQNRACLGSDVSIGSAVLWIVTTGARMEGNCREQLARLTGRRLARSWFVSCIPVLFFDFPFRCWMPQVEKQKAALRANRCGNSLRALRKALPIAKNCPQEQARFADPRILPDHEPTRRSHPRLVAGRS